MSYEESAILLLTYIPYGQNHSTFPPIASKNNLKKVISTEEPGNVNWAIELSKNNEDYVSWSYFPGSLIN